MSDEPSNAVIVEMIKGFRDLTETKFEALTRRMEERFKQDQDSHHANQDALQAISKENAKNTRFRERWSGISIILLAFITFLVPIIQWLITRKLLA